MRASLPRTACAAALVALLVSGCGGSGAPKKVKITGKFLKDGQPATYTKDTYVTLIFKPIIPMKGNNPDGTAVATSYSAKVQPELGTYEVTVPAGKYQVNLFIPPPPNAPPGSVPSPTADNQGKIYDLNADQTLDLPVPTAGDRR